MIWLFIDRPRLRLEPRPPSVSRENSRAPRPPFRPSPVASPPEEPQVPLAGMASRNVELSAGRPFPRGVKSQDQPSALGQRRRLTLLRHLFDPNLSVP